MKLPWLWRAPAPSRLLHTVSRRKRTQYAVAQIEYVLGCGHALTVDDVNSRTRVFNEVPTCLRCMIAPDNPDVIDGT